MQILIPTLGRPTAEKQVTYNVFEQAGYVPILIVSSLCDVPPGDFKCVVMPSTNVAEARNNCLEFAFEHKVLIVDDDLTFHIRKGLSGFHLASPDDISEMVRGLDIMLERHAHGGIPSLTGALWAKRLPYDFNNRYLALAAFNLDLFPQPWPKYRLKVHEDIDFNLQLIRAGRPNFVWNEWAYTDPGHVEGGVQTYATDAMRDEEHDKLCAFHPDYFKNGKVQWKELRKRV